MHTSVINVQGYIHLVEAFVFRDIFLKFIYRLEYKSKYILIWSMSNLSLTASLQTPVLSI